jgi:hypothetical protein
MILAASILMQGGTLTGTTQPVCYNISQAKCTQDANGVTIHCPGPGPGFNNLTTCVVASTCTPVLPSPAYCFAGQQVINPGATEVLKSTQVSNQGLFNFGAIGSAGIIAMVGVAVAVSVLAGFNILGSGLNQESIRILFFGGLLTGVWLFMSSLEGFVGGAANSFFTQLDKSTVAFGLPPFGTIGYVILTIFEVFGIASFISGGDSA